jgi:hypothetical protein
VSEEEFYGKTLSEFRTVSKSVKDSSDLEDIEPIPNEGSTELPRPDHRPLTNRSIRLYMAPQNQ